jgi:hypothetical protein
MALRIARGLFRLWLVLSVLWIGGVGAVTWRANERPPLESFLEEQGKPDAPGTTPAPKNELPDAPWVLERRSAVRFAVLLALVPPAFVLALGSAFVWAFRGFR